MAKSQPLLKITEIEQWRIMNDHIWTGYARLTGSWSGVAYSVFGFVHNETVNIWSHLIGAVVALLMLSITNLIPFESSLLHFLPPNTTLSPSNLSYSSLWASLTCRRGILAPLYYLYPPPELSNIHHPLSSLTWHDKAGFDCYFSAAFICLFGSALYHASKCHSEKVCNTFSKVDYAGIVILIAGSFYPSLYYGFYCDPIIRTVYSVGITIAGAVTLYAIFSPTYGSSEYRRERTYIYMAMGLCAIFPVFHGIFKYGLEQSSNQVNLPCVVTSGALYLAGALIYAEQFPERIYPGRFDIIGSSHQIFHFLILFAAVAHYCSLSGSFRYWHFQQQGLCV